MSTLIWFILIAAFMFFMHRGHGSHGGGMGCCGGHDHASPDEKDHQHDAKPDIAAIPEADYEEVEDEPVREIERDKDEASIHRLQRHKHTSNHLTKP